METTTAQDTAHLGRGWTVARSTTLGIVLVGSLGAIAGFIFARILWM
jgi:hypothetical protein